MAHTPHVFVEGPWETDPLPLRPQAQHHLERVLRLAIGAPVSYTDGAGSVGAGRLAADGIGRGTEHAEPVPPFRLTVAVAPPKSTDRKRFLVEKLAEVGVDRLVWITTQRSEGTPPKPAKATAWAIAALEQSRRSRLLSITGAASVAAILQSGERCLVADRGGAAFAALQPPEGSVTLLVGPEGGFAAHEIPDHLEAVALGDGILRVETAAVVGAALAIATWRIGPGRGD